MCALLFLCFCFGQHIWFRFNISYDFLKFKFISDTNNCIGNPCDNGGTCIDVINGYYCSCLNGYTGLSCESG